MPQKNSVFSLLVGGALLALAGCQSVLPTAPQTSEITALTQRINQLETKAQTSTANVEKTQNTIDTASQQVIADLQAQRQKAANAVYAAQQANQQNPQKSGYTTAVGDALQIAAAILGGADAQGTQDAATELKLQLAGTQTSLAQLQAMHDAQLKAAGDLQTQLTQEQKTRSDAQSQLEQLQTARNDLQSKVQGLEDQRNQAQTTLAQKLQAENDRLASDQALRGKLVMYLVIAGVLAGLAAAVALRIYPSIGLHLGLASGGFFLAAYLVTEIAPWVVLLIVGLSVGAIVLAVIVRHRRVSSIADSALGAIQQLKIRAEHGDAIAVQAWQTVDGDLKNHFASQVGSLEAEAKERLAKLPWVPHLAPRATPVLPMAAPAVTTPPVPASATVTTTVSNGSPGG